MAMLGCCLPAWELSAPSPSPSPEGLSQALGPHFAGAPQAPSAFQTKSN